ncbi:MAG: hypothetical protein WCP73_10045, partial [Eubacteriales bacterium]
PIESLFIDPAVKNGGTEEPQYIDYVYPMQMMNFRIIYAKAMAGRPISEFVNTDVEQRVFDTDAPINPDVVLVTEHWYRQPKDGEITKTDPDTKEKRIIKWEAGEMACTIMAGGKELKNIEKYWEKTGPQNKRFPFVHYWRINDENSFYNKSELFSILTMVDTGDRVLTTAIMNEMLMGNDVIVQEDGALCEDSEITNVPGNVIKVHTGKLGAISRLGGLHDTQNSTPMLEYVQSQIERATRNYDTNMGKETARVNTASGLAQIRQDASEQADIKKADRLNGFKRLFELIDWTALEFYDDSRLIYIGSADPKKGIKPFVFNSDDIKQAGQWSEDPKTGEIIEGSSYYPEVDASANAGDGIVRSKGATLEVLGTLANINVTELNYKILAAQLEILDIPQKKDITDLWESLFAPAI